jgi:hypothetical protein
MTAVRRSPPKTRHDHETQQDQVKSEFVRPTLGVHGVIGGVAHIVLAAGGDGPRFAPYDRDLADLTDDIWARAKRSLAKTIIG